MISKLISKRKAKRLKYINACSLTDFVKNVDNHKISYMVYLCIELVELRNISIFGFRLGKPYYRVSIRRSGFKNSETKVKCFSSLVKAEHFIAQNLKDFRIYYSEP